MKEKLEYNQDWSKFFQVKQDCSSGLVRIKDKFGRDVKSYLAGKKCFGKNGSPLAWRVNFKSKAYQVHRIIWVLVHGCIDPDLVIDHLDGNPFNNHLENLSLKSIADNTKNKRQAKNNTTGTTGVTLREPRLGYRYYTAQWSELDGTRNCKSFSVDYLGEEEAEEQAIAHRKKQIQRLISEGGDYTERHGI